MDLKHVKEQLHSRVLHHRGNAKAHFANAEDSNKRALLDLAEASGIEYALDKIEQAEKST